MEAAGALVAIATNLGTIKNPFGDLVGPWGNVVVIRTFLSDQIPTCLIARIGGIKLQLLCGVKITYR